MIKVGSSYNNTAKESKKMYIQVGFDDALLPLTITKDHVLTLHQNEGKEKDNHPDYHTCLRLKKDKDETNS